MTFEGCSGVFVVAGDMGEFISKKNKKKYFLDHI